MNQMSAEDLLKSVLKDLNTKEVHPIHRAILLELCQSAMRQKPDATLESLIEYVISSFYIANNIFCGIIESAAAINGGYPCTVDYGGNQYVIEKKMC